MSTFQFSLVRTCHIIPRIAIWGYAYFSFPQLKLGASLITHYSSLIPVGFANAATAGLLLITHHSSLITHLSLLPFAFLPNNPYI
jgi:hypothetical protein